MDKVPTLISTKDLAYIKDMLSWNLQAAKKINHYLKAVNDEEIKTLLQSVVAMHTNHYYLILSYLE